MAKKYRVIADGIFGSSGEVAIGTEFTAKEIPAGLEGKVELTSESKEDAELIAAKEAEAKAKAEAKKK